MEYLLLGVLLVGVLLFVVGWLVMVGICFQRHPVTGLVALIPGLNLLTLPAMWHRVSAWVITSVIGVLLMGVAWFAGANNHVYRYAQGMGLNVAAPVASSVDIPVADKPAEVVAPTVVTHALDIPPAAKTGTAVPATSAATPESVPVVAPTAPPAPAQPKAPTPAELLAGAKELPASALYHVVFKNMEVSKLAENAGQYVRITQKDGRKREGKLTTASSNDIGLEERLEGGAITRTIKLSDIREASLMTHEQGKE